MLIPVILSGGAGTRLWPVSREASPKPFMRIGGGKSLLLQTLERAEAVGDAPALVVTNREYYFQSRDELNGRRLPPHYLLESAGRNTAPAIAAAALWAQRQYGDPCLLVMPADHLVTGTDAFVAAAREAESVAKAGSLVLFGVTPTAPETGFGYIALGAPLNGGGQARTVSRFVEKPDLATAERYMAEGGYVWNSGMFCFKASTILEAFAAHAPALLAAAQAVYERSRTEGDRTELDRSFAELENVSIDYAVMERASDIAVIPAEFGWSDIGSWKAVAETLPPDGSGNTCSGDSLFIDSKGTHVECQGNGRFVAAIGLDNMLIVDTPDALLVADKRKCQDVRKVVSHLKEAGHDAYKLHRTVSRPWGSYTVLESGPGFKIKRIVVKPGGSLSLQMHHYRSEHWVIVSGTASVTLDANTSLFGPNESTYIPIGAKHRLHNPAEEELVMIEVQCGSYLGEDDIVRFTDNYGRA